MPHTPGTQALRRPKSSVHGLLGPRRHHEIWCKPSNPAGSRQRLILALLQPASSLR